MTTNDGYDYIECAPATPTFAAPHVGILHQYTRDGFPRLVRVSTNDGVRYDAANKNLLNGFYWYPVTTTGCAGTSTLARVLEQRCGGTTVDLRQLSPTTAVTVIDVRDALVDGTVVARIPCYACGPNGCGFIGVYTQQKNVFGELIWDVAIHNGDPTSIPSILGMAIARLWPGEVIEVTDPALCDLLTSRARK